MSLCCRLVSVVCLESFGLLVVCLSFSVSVLARCVVLYCVLCPHCHSSTSPRLYPAVSSCVLCRVFLLIGFWFTTNNVTFYQKEFVVFIFRQLLYKFTLTCRAANSIYAISIKVLNFRYYPVVIFLKIFLKSPLS